MKKSATFALSAIAGAAAFAGIASAATMSPSDCQQVWKSLDASGSGSVTMSQAQPYVTDFKAIDTNSDGKLSASEFTAGCSKGLVHSTASSGAASGASGSTSGTDSSGSMSKPSSK